MCALFSNIPGAAENEADEGSPRAPLGLSSGMKLIDLEGLCVRRQIVYKSAAGSDGRWHSFAALKATATDMPDQVAVTGDGPRIAIVDARALNRCVTAHRFRTRFGTNAHIETFDSKKKSNEDIADVLLSMSRHFGIVVVTDLDWSGVSSVPKLQEAGASAVTCVLTTTSAVNRASLNPSLASAPLAVMRSSCPDVAERVHKAYIKRCKKNSRRVADAV